MEKVININNFQERKNQKQKSIKKVQSAIDNAIWCKHCGAMLGIYDPKTEECITEGNFCPHCGTQIYT